MTNYELLTVRFLKKVFKYKDGILYWKIAFKKTTIIGSEAGKKIKRTGYIKLNILCNEYLMHRVIFFMHHGYWPEFIDHIDRDRSNNKISNLRACTHKQNMQNRSKRKTTTTSKYLGVRKIKKGFKVVIKGGGQYNNLGVYKDEKEAAKVYNKAALVHYGEFAPLNKID